MTALSTRIIRLIVCAVLPIGLLNAQDQTVQPSSALPLTFDVRVGDPLGRPITTLTSADFVVEVDGQVRPVSSVAYVPFDTGPGVPAAPATTNASTLNNRAFVVVVDDLSFDATLPRRIIDDLSRWVVSLGPSDAVGFATTSGRVGFVPPSRDRAAAVAALQEAIAGRLRFAVDADRNALEQLNALHDIVRQLHRAQGSRAVLLISNGFGTGLGAEAVTATRRVLEQAGARLYGITPDRGAPQPGEAADGLQTVVAGAGGRIFKVTDALTTALASVVADMPGAYRLVVDASTPAPEGPYRLVKVTTRDAAALVETPTRILTPAVTVNGAAIEDRVRTILRDGEPAFGVPIDSVGVVGRDEASGQLRLLNTVTVPDRAAAPLTMTFVLLDEKGAEVRGGTGRVGDAVGGEFRTSFAISLAPGRYRLRVAVVDAAGHIGATERGLIAGMRPIGSLVAGDPQIVWRGEAPPWYLASRQIVPATARALAIGFEMFAEPSTSQTASTAPTVSMALIASDGREVSKRDLTAAPIAGGFRVASEIAIEALPPGMYDLSLSVKTGASEPVPVHAWIRRGGATPARAPKPTKNDFLAMFQTDVRTLWPRFDAGTTLTAGVARRLMQELATDVKRPVPAALSASLTSEQWVAGLTKVTGQQDGFGSMARAILALAKGDAAAATTAIAETRKAAPDSTALEILTGAAHAAAGRDREAIEIWRDAIGTLAADPDWTLPLAEALGRTGDYAAALDALALLPRDPSRVESVRAIDAAIALGRYDQARAAAEKGRAGTGTYQGRLEFYALVFAYADALAPDATDATKRAFTTAGEAYVKTGAELAPLVRAWIESLGN